MELPSPAQSACNQNKWNTLPSHSTDNEKFKLGHVWVWVNTVDKMLRSILFCRTPLRCSGRRKRWWPSSMRRGYKVIDAKPFVKERKGTVICREERRQQRNTGRGPVGSKVCHDRECQKDSRIWAVVYLHQSPWDVTWERAWFCLHREGLHASLSSLLGT